MADLIALGGTLAGFLLLALLARGLEHL